MVQAENLTIIPKLRLCKTITIYHTPPTAILTHTAAAPQQTYFSL